MTDYDWKLYPDAEIFLSGQVEHFLKENSYARRLADHLLTECSTRFFDWIDHIVIPDGDEIRGALDRLGFRKREVDCPDDIEAFALEGTTYFPVLLTQGQSHEIALKPEEIVDFYQMRGLGGEIEGENNWPYRRVVVDSQSDYVLSAVERRGYDGFLVEGTDDMDYYCAALEAFSCRRRHFDDPVEGIHKTADLVASHLKRLSGARVTDAFFRAERTYWQRSDKAGYIQRARQDQFGLGWGNHDHHTYRSSRNNFSSLINILESMGFESRELFFAGEQAGWGAQVLEHPVCKIVIFADVDISKEERDQDFAHEQMSERQRLGTVGLWVALHGESMLDAGLHHLAARVDFIKARTGLERLGIGVLRPFSNFDFLKQSFTESYKRIISSDRLDLLVERERITADSKNRFMNDGAIGSHLEIIQRSQGFKGFNQDSVTAIINETDPRRVEPKHA